MVRGRPLFPGDGGADDSTRSVICKSFVSTIINLFGSFKIICFNYLFQILDAVGPTTVRGRPLFPGRGGADDSTPGLHNTSYVLS